MSTLPVVGFAGMTHLGINSAVATAARGMKVVGYHDDTALIGRLRRGELPVIEPGLDALLAQEKGKLAFADDTAALEACDIVVISADVPTSDQAVSDLTPIRTLIGQVLPALRDDAILVVLCQVPPGFSRSLLTAAGGHIGPDRLFYQVETLVFGNAVERALNPERFIVGCADPEKPLPPAYSRMLEAFGCPILPMRYESAELAKIGINCCLVASVSTANTLAELSEAVGADWAEIVPALKLDRRIGPHSYLAPGLGIAGGNLERDLRTVLTLGTAHGSDIGVVEAWLANSEHRKDWTWRVLRDHVLSVRPDPVVAVLGLAYKQDTHSTKNSPSLRFLSHLRDHAVRVHDPVVPASAAPGAVGCGSALECAEGADVLVIATPWREYAALALPDLVRAMRGRVLIDPYRMLDAAAAESLGFSYHALGRGAVAAAGDDAC